MREWSSNGVAINELVKGNIYDDQTELNTLSSISFIGG